MRALQYLKRVEEDSAKRAATRWRSISEPAGDIRFSKSFRRPKGPLDARFGGGSCRAARAILRLW